MSALPEQIDIFVRFCAVYAVVFLFFILNSVSLSLPISGSLDIPFNIMVIYYWAIYRPRLLPPWLIFLAGIAFDSMSGMPLGMNAFIFLALRWLVVDQRLFLMGQSFAMVWLLFAGMSFICLVSQWALYGLIHFYWTPFIPVAFTFIAGFVVYPVVGIILNVSHRILPVEETSFGLIIK